MVCVIYIRDHRWYEILDIWDKKVKINMVSKINSIASGLFSFGKSQLKRTGSISAADSLEKTLMLGKIEGRKRRGWQWMRWLDGIMDSMDINLSQFRKWWITGMPGMLQSMGLQRVRHDWVTEQQQQEERDLNSLEINPNCMYIKLFKYIFYLKS